MNDREQEKEDVSAAIRWYVVSIMNVQYLGPKLYRESRNDINTCSRFDGMVALCRAKWLGMRYLKAIERLYM